MFPSSSQDAAKIREGSQRKIEKVTISEKEDEREEDREQLTKSLFLDEKRKCNFFTLQILSTLFCTSNCFATEMKEKTRRALTKERQEEAKIERKTKNGKDVTVGLMIH